MGKVPRVGFLWTGSPEFTTHALDAFRQGLREAGHIEGTTIVIEHRWAADAVQRLPDLATELVRNKVDIVVTQGTPAAQAAKRATTTIPIVMAISGDAVATGLVASLAHPGGNVSGMTLLPELISKRLELLKEVMPNARRIAVIVDEEPRTAAASRALGAQLQILEVRGRSDFEKAFETATKARAEALVVSQSPILRFHVKAFVDLAAKHRERRAGLESGEAVEIGDDVWVGGGAIICPGVRIGARSVIGAGSVVTRAIPEGVFAAGNPCRVVREVGL